jgi:hypothetical protein
MVLIILDLSSRNRFPHHLDDNGRGRRGKTSDNVQVMGPLLDAVDLLTGSSLFDHAWCEGVFNRNSPSKLMDIYQEIAGRSPSFVASKLAGY